MSGTSLVSSSLAGFVPSVRTLVNYHFDKETFDAFSRCISSFDIHLKCWKRFICDVDFTKYSMPKYHAVQEFILADFASQ